MICGRRQKSVVENLSVCWQHSLLGNLQSEIDSVAFCFRLPVNAPGYEITGTPTWYPSNWARAYEHLPVEFRPVEFRPVEFRPVEFRPVQIRPGEIR